jgi:hypothetical protein
MKVQSIKSGGKLLTVLIARRSHYFTIANYSRINRTNTSLQHK